jgi:GT2 family glycosyltransferase/glycosyltransferase involved in cell wall biosynthesis
MQQFVIRFFRLLPLACLSVVITPLAWLLLTLTDLLWALFGRRRTPVNTRPNTTAASIVIPNWNGRDLLEKYLPSVIEATSANPRNEIIVVDDASTDGSAAFVRERFPAVRLIAHEKNRGFGAGATRGFREARNDIVVLLNSDMRVAPDFLPPLLDGFTDETVFAVSCQIFFSDPNKRREETGLTSARWSEGALRVRHVADGGVNELFPCFYAGGGSSAFDRRKFLDLGGFDHLLRPFYLEDTDVGYMAWKRGWKVLYQPASHVWHEHRGTIGRRFSPRYIESIVAKNFLLFAWKNIHEPARLAGHFFFAWSGSILSWIFGESRERASLTGLGRAFLQIPACCAARWRARSLAVVDDSEAFLRPMAGIFHDRFHPPNPPTSPLNILFVAPYAICPPTHGGAVFMRHAVRQLGPICRLHAIVMIDIPAEAGAHAELEGVVQSIHYRVRLEGHPKGIGAITPYAVREFIDPDLEWMIHRQIFLNRIDVVQIEYTQLGQYVGPYRRLVWAMFEHDVYFQSVLRVASTLGALGRAKAWIEYLRALHYELRLLPRFDAIQACSEANRAHLLSYLPGLKDRIDATLRAGIDVSAYPCRLGGRIPKTMLFLGSFRHLPNQTALRWFLESVMPLVLGREPEAKLIVIGSDPPPAHTIPDLGGAVEIHGFVADLAEPLTRYSVFVCPILSGSGIRVKLLEAFASGIPCVSTRIGAEGISAIDGEVCALADSPLEFAQRIVALLSDEDCATAMAGRARDYVMRERNIVEMAKRLEATYRRLLASKARSAAS